MTPVHEIKSRYPNSYRTVFLDDKSGCRITIDFTKTVTDKNNPDSDAIRWVRQGLLDHVLDSYWWVETTNSNDDGILLDGDEPSIVSYNPVLHANRDIDFKWILPATEENFRAILDEIISRVENGLIDG